MYSSVNKQKKGIDVTFPISEDIGDGILVCDIGHSITSVGYEYGPAIREYNLIHVVVKGRGKFLREGKAYEIHEGDAFLIRPMEVTLYGADRDNSWEYYWIGFRGENARSLIDYVFPNGECISHADKQAVMAFTAQCSALKQGEIDQLAIRSTLYALLSTLRKSIVGHGSPDVGIVEQALSFIEANYFRPISVTLIASELGVTRSYFTSLFTEKVGQSPYNYVTKLRIEKAKQLIENGKMLTASEIAYSVGFSSLERFSEMFKKYVGVSPQVYKKSLK